MDLKDKKTKEYIQAIFQGKGGDVVGEILKEKIDLPLDVIKLGIEHQKMRFVYDKGNKITRTQKPTNHEPDINQFWIQSLAYSTDVNREEYIYQLFLKYPHIKGVTLLTLCAINIKKAVYWLKIIKEIDPLLISLKFPRSALVDDLCQKYNCQMDDLFNTIIFANEESTDEQKIDKRLSFIIKSKANTPDPDELKLVYDERRRIIASGKLSPSQADKIFNALWDVNVEIGKPQRKRIKSKQEFQRDPFKFFRSSSVNYDGGRFIENAAEVKDLIYTLPYVSNKYLDRIKLLFDLLPIWDKKYKTVSECMYRFDEDQFFAGWEKLLIKESKSKPKGDDQFIFSSKGITKLDAGRKGRKQKEHYFPALEILDIMFADNYKGLKPLLLELIEHPSPLVREKVKELLSK